MESFAGISHLRVVSVGLEVEGFVGTSAQEGESRGSEAVSCLRTCCGSEEASCGRTFDRKAVHRGLEAVSSACKVDRVMACVESEVVCLADTPGRKMACGGFEVADFFDIYD